MLSVRALWTTLGVQVVDKDNIVDVVLEAAATRVEVGLGGLARLLTSDLIAGLP